MTLGESFDSPADVAQLVAHHLAKVRVASSSLVIRSNSYLGNAVSPLGGAAFAHAKHILSAVGNTG